MNYPAMDCISRGGGGMEQQWPHQNHVPGSRGDGDGCGGMLVF